MYRSSSLTFAVEFSYLCSMLLLSIYIYIMSIIQQRFSKHFTCELALEVYSQLCILRNAVFTIQIIDEFGLWQHFVFQVFQYSLVRLIVCFLYFTLWKGWARLLFLAKPSKHFSQLTSTRSCVWLRPLEFVVRCAGFYLGFFVAVCGNPLADCLIKISFPWAAASGALYSTLHRRLARAGPN